MRNRPRERSMTNAHALTGVRGIIFPRRGYARLVSWRDRFWLVILPVLGAVGWYLADAHTPLSFTDPGIVAASFGVLGLLFAHAIFVFQLRVSYDAAGREPAAKSA